MFGELTRDEVFRIETRRLWLRWPRASDAPAIAAFASRPEVALMTGSVPHPYPPGEAEGYVERVRAANAAGSDLFLAVMEKHSHPTLVGLIGMEGRVPGKALLGYMLAPEYWGRGYASEAASAIIDAAFLLTRADAVAATVGVGNAASMRVLEKCRFAWLGATEVDAPARGGTVAVDAFSLSRGRWRSGLIANRHARKETCDA